MAIPSFVGPLVSAVLFLLTVFGFFFYYCYFKPKRQRKKNEKRKTANQESPSFSSSRPSRAAKKSLSDEERFYGYNSALSAYSAAYCFHGGFPMVNPSCEQRWQPPIRKMKYQASALCKTKIEQHTKPDRSCCELRVDMLKERTVKKPCISRQLSSESRESRKVCHLQVIEECEYEEEKEENEETSEVNNDLESGKCNIVT